MSLEFEWDPSKAEENRKKHGVGFDETSARPLLPCWRPSSTRAAAAWLAGVWSMEGRAAVRS
jgi:uncharacterized DUF497 family protein